ncbi:hypothetical protein [Spirosoma sp. KNUC1025]|uniref:hypothetical protein n=1 Tax=Spirosoma sp. KNUC1025 TaxID=2894082 RepID=UPI0038633372
MHNQRADWRAWAWGYCLPVALFWLLSAPTQWVSADRRVCRQGARWQAISEQGRRMGSSGLQT